MDIKISTEEGNFKYRVAGILFDKNGRILIQKIANNSFYCLPGGHVEIGETSLEAAKRELEEELQFPLDVDKPLFLIENIFGNAKNKTVHEIAIYYKLKSDDCPSKDWEYIENDKGVLKKLSFKWVNHEELSKIDFRPQFLKTLLFDGFEHFEHYVVKNSK